MANYDLLAPYYDEVMAAGGEPAVDVDRVKQWIELYGIPGGNILELACGTGTVLAQFSDRYHLSGLDVSPGMVEQARNKLPEADIRVGSMASFVFPGTFNVVLCLFDSMNHLTAFADWEACFERVATHLAPDGLFIFDVNTVGRHHEAHAEPPRVWQGRGATVTIDAQPGRHSLTDWHVTVENTHAAGAVRVRTETIPETAFPIGDIWAALADRFEILACVDGYGGEVSDDSDRVYFICRTIS